MSPSVKSQSTKSQSIRSQSIKPQPFKPQPVKSQPAKSLPIKSLPVKSQPIKSRGIKARPAILAASTGIIAIVGAWYGAGLKKDQEKKQVRTHHHLGLIDAQIANPSYFIDTLEALRFLLINRI